MSYEMFILVSCIAALFGFVIVVLLGVFVYATVKSVNK